MMMNVEWDGQRWQAGLAAVAVVASIAGQLSAHVTTSWWVAAMWAVAAVLVFRLATIVSTRNEWLFLEGRFRNLADRDVEPPIPGTPYHPQHRPMRATKEDSTWILQEGCGDDIRKEIRSTCVAAGKLLRKMPALHRRQLPEFVWATRDPLQSWLTFLEVADEVSEIAQVKRFRYGHHESTAVFKSVDLVASASARVCFKTWVYLG